MATRVVVVDDDPQILRAVRTSLHARGYEVATAGNGETALERLSTEPAELVILDLSLPGIDGHEVIRRLRSFSDVPVLVLSVREAQDEKITALDAGADDYVTKPFAIGELLARMRALERRTQPETTPPVLRFGKLEVDLSRQLVRGPKGPIHLTKTEYRLLEAFVSHPGKLLTHGWLLSTVWGPGYAAETHYVRVYVRSLRKKLDDDPSRPRFIVTEPGLGYRWRLEPDGA
ncbi:MAG TPA: response regulator transcription factor [Actinomycetota bacterium]|jgi:two-component system KDP operon response regulator KdpE|nr:response regulator transcription factor [Actinomycetota bacterium]